MITAHLAGGYILGRTAGWKGPVMAAALLGAIFPDIDLIWFYLIDDRAFHHHKYWVHAPAFAIGISFIVLGLLKLLRSNLFQCALAFCAGWCLHILLDAPMGGLMWAWPLSDLIYFPVVVPATHSHWLLSFIFHWSFLLELAVWGTAFWLFLKRRP